MVYFFVNYLSYVLNGGPGPVIFVSESFFKPVILCNTPWTSKHFLLDKPTILSDLFNVWLLH